MKKLIAFLILVAMGVSSSPKVFGQSATYGPMSCLSDLRSVDSQIISGLATALCGGASSPAVVQCYVQTMQLNVGGSYPHLGRGFAIELCKRATSLAPLACFKNAYFNNQKPVWMAIQLCATVPSRGNGNPED